MLETDHKLAGEAFARILEHYLGETLHQAVGVGAFQETGSLPTFLSRTYRFYKASIAGRACVFLAAGEISATPSDISKHVALVQSKIDAIVVFAVASMSAHNRSRLISQGIPFVVPGNQLYIPALAMDLREHFRAPRLPSAEGLSPAAQAVLFRHLLRPSDEDATPSIIAERLAYSAMSIGRAFDDLEAAGLASTEKRGKERHLQFKWDRRTLLEKSRSRLRSPVRSVKYVRDLRWSQPLKLAGESALAELTDLSTPQLPTYAIASSGWKAIAAAFSLVEVTAFEADAMVETWSYDPAKLSDRPTVDPLSLYAQFREHRDERVAMAAERLLETLQW